MIVSFKTAKLAKEKGFSEKTSSHWQRDYGDLENDTYPPLDSFTFWNNIPYRNSSEVELVPAPTQSELQKWLRDKHEIHVEVRVYSCSKPEKFEYEVSILDKSYGEWVKVDSNLKFEKSLEKGLQEALKLI